jgi:uncharacterized protein (TIGR03435 family)
MQGGRCVGGPGTRDPERLACQNVSLSMLVMMAYDLRPFQLKAPAWMDDYGYDVAARIASGADRPHFDLMLQDMLATRFGLQMRREKQCMTACDLIVGKGGPKLTRTQDQTL